MKFTCDQDKLQKALSAVSRAIPNRSSLPITNHILIDAGNNEIVISATDAETMAITYSLPANVGEMGALALPSRLLTDFITSLPPDMIDFGQKADSYQALLTCAKNKSSIEGIDPSEFPPIPKNTGSTQFKLSASKFKSAIAKVVFSAATDDSRPILMGVQFLIQDSELTLAAADGFRLSVCKIKLETDQNAASFVVPARALSELGKLLIELGDNQFTMTVNDQNTQVEFDLGFSRMVSQLLQGTFPKYDQLIPDDWKTKITISAKEFIRETKIASIFARDGSGIIRLNADASSGKLQIMAKAEELGMNESEIITEIQGDDLKIAFNSRYLMDILQILENGMLIIEGSSPQSPGVIKSDDHEDFIHVVMPMFVQW